MRAASSRRGLLQATAAGLSSFVIPGIIRAQSPMPKGAVLIWDGAGFHTGKDLVVPGNVSLIRLPPYSPELNPVENLWHYLRSHHWSNREYEGYQGLQEEAVRSVRAVCQDAEKLKTICNADYVNRRA